MSRRPNPTALRLVAGNAGHRPLPKDEPELPVGATMPPNLSEDARKHWPSVCKQLTDARVLTQLDALALASYCEMYAQWRDACDKVIKFGAAVKTKGGGGVKLSPYWIAFMQAASEMRKMLVEFGMTPSARARVAAIGGRADDDDPFEDFE